MEYIRVPAVMNKLKKAEAAFLPVYMMAASGFGKTAAARFVSRRRPALWLSAKGGILTERPDITSIRKSLVIVDDLQWLADEESRQYVRELLRTPGIQIFLLSRGDFPKWLVKEEMELDFVRITEQDFCLTGDCVRRFFNQKQLTPGDEELKKVEQAAHGYPFALLKYAEYMEQGAHFSESMEAAVWQEVYLLWDTALFCEWENSYRDLVMAVCPYDTFTEEMARLLTGNSHIREALEYCRSMTYQLIVHSDSVYSLRWEIRRFLIWKRSEVWSEEKQKDNYRRAALYYELHSDIPKALRCYEKAGATEQVKDLLIRNAEKHPGVGHYFETREYYFRLPVDEIRDSPILMAGMSMLWSLILQPDRSEEWYRELDACEKNPMNSEKKRREAKIWLTYLNITLPHRGIRGMVPVLKHAFVWMSRGADLLPEMAVTGNMPSLMNGGLDFCEWSRKDTQYARMFGDSLEKLLRGAGKGLVPIALAESGFEKGTMAPADVYTRLGRGYEAAAHGGKIEMCFAAVGVLTRQYLMDGELQTAEREWDRFREKVKKEEADQLLPNLEAFDAWLSLFTSAGERRKQYLDHSDGEKESFCILDRYRSIVRLRCLVAENRLAEALELSGFLEGYVKPYGRTFLRIENGLMRAIARYRMGDLQWNADLEETLTLAGTYHLVRVIALEGAAILPLLQEYTWQGENRSFREQVMRETGQTALLYPDYMMHIPAKEIRLTERETQILSMLCSGMRMEEICTVCGISYSGMKKHNRSIYRKLGATNRAEAERKAAQLGLVHRGRN